MGERSWDFGLDPGQTFEPDQLDEATFDRSLPHVMTALGPVDPNELGVTLHHEYVVGQPSEDRDESELDDPYRALSALEEFYHAGGRTIVDLSTIDYGRDAEAIKWIAARSPVNLVVVTGHHGDQFATPHLEERMVEEIAAESVTEISKGMGTTDVCAGVILVGTSPNRITAVEERVLRAAAWAQRETGAPISILTHGGTMAIEQLSILREEGAEASRIIVGRMDRKLDLASLSRVLETGAFVSFDQISTSQYARDEERAAMAKQLVDAGYIDQLVLSGSLTPKLTSGGVSGWTYVIEGFPLMLMEQGMEAADVRRLLVENPARALTTRPPSRHIP